MQPQVLAAVADDTHAVGNGVEINAEALALQHHSRPAADGLERGTGRVNSEETPPRRHGIQHAARNPEVNAHEPFTRRQPLQRHARLQAPRLAGVEANQLGGVGHRPDHFASGRAFGLGSAGGQQGHSKADEAARQFQSK